MLANNWQLKPEPASGLRLQKGVIISDRRGGACQGSDMAPESLVLCGGSRAGPTLPEDRHGHQPELIHRNKSAGPFLPSARQDPSFDPRSGRSPHRAQARTKSEVGVRSRPTPVDGPLHHRPGDTTASPRIARTGWPTPRTLCELRLARQNDRSLADRRCHAACSLRGRADRSDGDSEALRLVFR